MNRFNAELDAAKAALQSCQQAAALSSCSQCEKLCDCQLRGEYVRAVYLSMSGGVSQNFNF